MGYGSTKIGDGLHGTPKYNEKGNVFFINGNNLINGKVHINKETKRIDETQRLNDKLLLNNNTILMSINGTIGNLARYNNEKIMLGKSVAYITVSIFDKNFIYYYLQNTRIRSYFINNLTGSTIKNLSLKTIRETSVTFPNNAEQKTLGRFFEKIDQTITLHQRLICIFIRLKYSLKEELFLNMDNKDYGEKIFQDNFVKELTKYKWNAPDELNGNLHRVTVDTLINHWRKELNRINADQLEGVELTDDEFSQVMNRVNQINNSYDAAKLLSIEDSKGKIDGIFRTPNPKITREQITLTIFKKAQVSGGDSSYNIAREVVTKNGNRFDIVLLINGLPLINIEQKRADIPVSKAFNQFKRYYVDGEFNNNFMAFSQMMVITSETDTRYFATPKSVSEFNMSFVFHWSDENNNKVTNWEKIVEYFLMIPMAHQMVGDYLVIDESKDPENRRHMLMRPYQVYALRAIESAAMGWKPHEKSVGGYVWHTTGSGKTITSFKTALFLSTRAGFDKVIFLVDRRELDSRTSENFKAYASYEPVDVDDTKSTYQLKKQLLSKKNGIVVTTTFKLHSLVKEMIENDDPTLRDMKMVFIIDEAHRTTMGQMMGTIKEYFRRKSLFYGFTGTPLFDENNVRGKINQKSEVINTTEKLFGPMLHKYTIDEAIADKNVLGFHVDYINTGEFNSYESLKELIIERKLFEKPNLSKRTVEKEVMALSEYEVENLAKGYGILVYQDKSHIPRVVSEILANWEEQSQGGFFNAILTVAFKKRVIEYYKEFKRQMEDFYGRKPNIAISFSFGSDEEEDVTVDIEFIKEMFKDYSKFTGIEFIAGNKKHGEEAYFEDLVARATRGGSKRNEKNIDIIIVADQFLTGYDSKYLNTLYVDRSLELQGLIQAYSRTNRIYGKEKEFGTIINFKYPRMTESIVNEALELYGSGGKNSPAIVDEYETAIGKLVLCFENLQEYFSNPTDWGLYELDEAFKKEFKLLFRESSKQLNTSMQYYEFEWDDDVFGMTQQKWLQYIGAYRNLFPGQEPPDERVVELVSNSKLVGVQHIDEHYILKLIGQKTKVSNGVQTVDQETLRIIYEQIQELSNMGDDEKAKLLREFVDTELLEGHVAAKTNFDQAFEEWKLDKRNKEIIEFANNYGLDSKLLILSVDDYSDMHPDVIPLIEEINSSINFGAANEKLGPNLLKHKIEVSKKVKTEIPMFKLKYK
ncbi:type I restriction endonuclease subunit R, EcoR124 family [Macrococcus equi]|uniref:type I restriction endonuclease subunit R, EcoR124 family n=1 Tax=Macrococcus equi TaxID=3395462 RepID=UPI0039BE138D